MKFDIETHTYFDDNNNKIPSVSEITRNWLGNKYENIDKAILVRRQNEGNIAHQQSEDFLIKGIGPTNPCYEFKELKELLKDTHITATHSEQIIIGASDYGSYAGTYDLFDSVNGILYDIKTNYNLDEEYVKIQLSLYAMALRQQDVKITKAYVIHLPSEKSPQKPQIKEIKLMSDEECTEIIRAYFAGEHKPQLNLECLDETAIQKLETGLLAIQKLEDEIKDYKEKILAEMEQRQINQIKIGQITISYIQPTVRESLDSKKIKSELPKIYEQYKKVSNIKSSVRITIKGE